MFQPKPLARIDFCVLAFYFLLLPLKPLFAQNQLQTNKLEQLLKQLETAKEDTNKVNLLDKIATAYRGTDKQNVILYANRQLELSKRLNWVKGEVLAYLTLGVEYHITNESQKAVEVCQRGYELAKNNHLPSFQYLLLERKALANIDLKNDDQALHELMETVEYYQGVNISSTIHPTAHSTRWWFPAFQIGSVFGKQKRDAAALEFYGRLLDYYKLGNDTANIINALNLISTYKKSYTKDYNSALEYAFKNLDYYGKGDTSISRAESFSSIALLYSQQQNYVKALEYYRAAVALRPAGDLRTKMSVSSGMSQIYGLLGDYSSKLKLDLELLDNTIIFTQGFVSIYIYEYGPIVEDYIALKKYDQALLYLNKALQLSTKLEEPDMKASFLGMLSYIYYLMQLYDDALRTVTESLQIKDQGEYYLYREYLYKGMIIRDAPDELLRKYGIPPEDRYQQALINLKLALKFSNKLSKFDSDLQMIYKELSETYKMVRDYKGFYDTYPHYIAMRDSSVNRTNLNAFLSKLSEIEFEKKEDSLKYQQRITNEKLRQQAVSNRQERRYYISGIIALLVISFFIARNYINQRKSNLLLTAANTEITQANQEITAANQQIHAEKQRSDNLLLNILPADVAEELKEKGSAGARLYEEVTVLFTDFVNFTAISELLTPQELVDELHTCFKAFDEIIDKYGIEKIKTIGDAYLAVAGLPNADAQHGRNTVKAALEIRQFIRDRKQQMGSSSFDIRIGIHSGSVVAGIVGVKKFAYDIWGDTVNTAARMEQHSSPGQINLSEKTYELVKDQFDFTYRGEIEAKNKGALKMYFVEKQSAGMTPVFS